MYIKTVSSDLMWQFAASFPIWHPEMKGRIMSWTNEAAKQLKDI
jgi:hypothetical protein